AVVLQLNEEPIGPKPLAKRPRRGPGLLPAAGRQECGDLSPAAAAQNDEAVAPAPQIVPLDSPGPRGGRARGSARAARRCRGGQGRQAAQVAVPLLVAGQNGQVVPGGSDGQLAAKHGMKTRLPGGPVKAGGAKKGVVVRQGQRPHL